MQISKETANRLFDVLYNLAEVECILENFRVELSRIQTYVPYETFQYLDFNSNGYLTSEDIFEFLKSRKYPVSEKQCFYLLKQYDSSTNNRLIFKDFLKIVLPRNNSDLRFDVVQRPNSEIDRTQNLSMEIADKLSKLLFADIKYQKETEKLRSRLAVRFDFDPRKAYEFITGGGYMDFDCIEVYFGEKGSDELVEALMRRLDMDGDCKISFLEFMEGITPVKPKTKIKPEYMKLTNACLIKTVNDEEKLAKRDIRAEIAKCEVQTKKELSVKFSKNGTSKNESLINKSECEKSKSFKEQLENEKPKISPRQMHDILLTIREEMKLENSIDSIRQNLALREDFAISKFRDFFKSKTKCLEFVMSILKISSNYEEIIEELFNRFENSNLKKFIDNIFLPTQVKYSDLMLSREQFIDKNTDFKKVSNETLGLVGNLLKSFWTVSQKIRKMKENCDETNLEEIFRYFDKKNKNCLNIEDVFFSYFYRKNLVYKRF